LQLGAVPNELRKASNFILPTLTLQVQLTIILVHGAGLVQVLELPLLNYGVREAAVAYNVAVVQQALFREIQVPTVKLQ
jgi:hypothetical protein